MVHSSQKINHLKKRSRSVTSITVRKLSNNYNRTPIKILGAEVVDRDRTPPKKNEKTNPTFTILTTPAYADIKQEFVTSAQISIDSPYVITNAAPSSYSISGNNITTSGQEQEKCSNKWRLVV